MARIRPFAAFRFDLSKVKAADVLTQPYDKITPAMREAYLAKSPDNIVRAILGETQPGDDERHNVYTRAFEYLRDRIIHGVIRQDSRPSIYPYTQTFTVPGSQDLVTRRGFIALGGLEEYSKGVVHRHEHTLSGPKQDRLNLLRATHTHFGQIFMLYSDPSQATEAELLGRASAPILEATDEYGTHHRLFQETEFGVMDRLQKAMAAHKLVIADGHHRYETALAFGAEQRARSGTPDGAAPWDWVMMTFVNLDAPGLVVLPTHRVLHSLPDFDPAQVRKALADWFTLEPVAMTAAQAVENWPALREQLAAAALDGTPAMLLALPDSLDLLRPRPDRDLAAELPQYSAAQRQLDVLLLHELGLHKALGITPEAVREQRNLRYVRDAPEALQSVAQGGAQACFLLNPVAPQTVRDVALAGGVMPQKSTDFYPKLMTGLTMYRAE
ncbi:MAG: DUF1015 domain-containing protein [Terriglobales bacterium]